MDHTPDNRIRNDNRNYDYSGRAASERAEFSVILDAIPESATVIDLGCGTGSLLALLRDRKGTAGVGIERSPSGVAIARSKGLAVREGSIDRSLTEFSDRQFDYAICNVTIQMVMYPEILLREMARISRYQIVSFPNFGFYRNRLDLLLHGRMPRPLLFGYEWYSTGHIHQLGYKDFHDLCEKEGLRVLKVQFAEQKNNSLRRILQARFPALFAVTCIFLLEKRN